MDGLGAPGEFDNLRSGPDVLYEHMRVVLALTEPRPRAIFLVDDVLATGANYVAAKTPNPATAARRAGVRTVHRAQGARVGRDSPS